ncbi:hypothetical protein QQG74_21755 [Micromonospora sp. FIMYZ51]|uniref:hypothetical protein n=1 Tax=Micromonospora sp. FIMYZ51 TaxID=3051832 RepID=UPI00311D588F
MGIPGGGASASLLKRKVRIRQLKPDQTAQGDAAIMIAMSEINSTRDFLVLGNTQAGSRFNYYLLLFSAGYAGAGALIGSPSADRHLNLTILVSVSAALLAVGLLTFERLAKSDVTRLEYLVMIDLYREFLLTKAPELRPYTLLPVQMPGAPIRDWKVQSAYKNLATTTSIMNSLAAAVAVAAIAQMPEGDLFLTIVFSLPILALSLAVQTLWLRRTRRRGVADLERRIRGQ